MITLKEAIKEFPEYNMKCLTQSFPENLSDLSFTEKIQYVGRTNVYVVVRRRDDDLFFGTKRKSVHRSGKNIYALSKWDGTIIISNNKVKAKCPQTDIIDAFYSYIDRPIVRDIRSDLKDFGYYQILSTAYMIKAILCNKVYSFETFYKEWMWRSYQLKGFNWKLFRVFKQKSLGFNLLDLKCFTKNLDASINRLLGESFEEVRLLNDILYSAIKLNEVVDFNWSKKRLLEEHKRQTQMLMAKQIDAKNVEPIYDLSQVKLNTNTIRVLNTERDVFMEGTIMHHCLYTNYFGKMKVHNHIAFHMESPESCTFSCVKDPSGNLIMDQIYLAYDRRVQPETKEQALAYIAQFSDIISKLLDGKSHPKERFAVDNVFDDGPLGIPGDLDF